MSIKDLKIGYVPYLPDLSQPGDRRRFPFFAKRYDIKFEIAQFERNYDIILVTATANLSKWLLYKKNHPKTKFIFEMVDSLIFPSDKFDTLFKGTGKFLLRKEVSLYVNYKNLIIQWIKNADLVICSSNELKKNVEKWNTNVLLSRDYLQNEYKLAKTEYSINGKMKLLWEGQGVILSQFLFFKEMLQEINSFCELHIITTEKYPLFGNLIHRDVEKMLKKLPIETTFHKWDIERNREIFSYCDCGIIPISPKNKLAWYKPANKLISFWFSGIPTVVSNTPAYSELMNNADSYFYCSNIDEWVSKLNMIKNLTEEERKRIAMKNLAYASKNFSNEIIDMTWKNIFKKLS
jgi:glycosyltransferase involved in cell wall biosynthesis